MRLQWKRDERSHYSADSLGANERDVPDIRRLGECRCLLGIAADKLKVT